jgi:hypothetical protein
VEWQEYERYISNLALGKFSINTNDWFDASFIVLFTMKTNLISLFLYDWLIALFQNVLTSVGFD